jgi:GMP synthase (glutamine-hydrolysing)
MNNMVLAIIHQENAGPGYFISAVAGQRLALEVANYAEGRRPRLPLGEYSAIAIFGGTLQVDEEDRYPWLIEEKRAVAEALEHRVPLLGICLGAQLMAESVGAFVGPTDPSRVGWGEVFLAGGAADDPLFSGLSSRFETVIWHKYEFGLPSRAVALAATSSAPQAFRMADQPAWAIQFHPEQPPKQVEVWLREALRRGEIDERERRRQILNGNRLRAHQERLAQHLFGRFLALAAQ